VSAVLKDLAEAEPQFRADAAIDKIVIARNQWERRRPKALSHREALMAIEPELLAVLEYGNAMAAGDYRSIEDHDRFLLALRRIATIRNEALR
jgi:hypothetical protein